MSGEIARWVEPVCSDNALPRVLLSVAGRNHPLQLRMERAHQPIQPFPHPRDRIDKFSRPGPSGRMAIVSTRETDPPAMFQVIAEFCPKLLKRTLQILLDVGSRLDPFAVGQITADNRITAVEVADERQSPIAPAGAPYLDVELQCFGDLGHLHGHVRERIVIERCRP